MNIFPTENRLLVKCAAKETQTPGGIYIPPTVDSKESLQEGTVIAVGPGELMDGLLKSPPCVVGDVVLFGQFSGAKLKVDGEDCILLHGTEIMALKKD